MVTLTSVSQNAMGRDAEASKLKLPESHVQLHLLVARDVHTTGHAPPPFNGQTMNIISTVLQEATCKRIDSSGMFGRTYDMPL
jgi:hypothetical protein